MLHFDDSLHVFAPGRDIDISAMLHYNHQDTTLMALYTLLCSKRKRALLLPLRISLTLEDSVRRQHY